MSERGSDAPKDYDPMRLTVAVGAGSDICPLCGIRRENAGFHRATCGLNYVKPGCFIVEEPAA